MKEIKNININIKLYIHQLIRFEIETIVNSNYNNNNINNKRNSRKLSSTVEYQRTFVNHKFHKNQYKDLHQNEY